MTDIHKQLDMFDALELEALREFFADLRTRVEMDHFDGLEDDMNDMVSQWPSLK